MVDRARADVSALSVKLGRILGASHVTNVRRLSGGASRETWAFTADGEHFILQRARAGAPGGLRSEPTVLTAARRAGAPVAELIVDGSGSEELERPFMIVRAVEGETIPRKILRDDSHSTARASLVGQLASAAARIHSIPPASVPSLTHDDQLDQFSRILFDSGEPHPVFEAAIRWLSTHRPMADRVTVVHGDFRLGNVVVDANGLSAVLDWELSHLGDPMEDLGWLCVRAWRFGGALPVAGLGTREELCDAYRRASGETPDLDAIRWWEVMGTLKWGIICIMQAQTHLRGIARSHELAAIGRRVCENEYDLIDLLEELIQ